jgi:hypothetical protein
MYGICQNIAQLQADWWVTQWQGIGQTCRQGNVAFVDGLIQEEWYVAMLQVAARADMLPVVWHQKVSPQWVCKWKALARTTWSHTLQWMLHREVSITSLWWGPVIGFINFHISCCVKSNLDCKNRKTWICRSDIVMNSAVPEGPINQMGSSQVNWWHQMELYSVLPSAIYFQSGM